MKINIILNVVKKGITDKIWMETLLDNVSTRPCFLSFARYALFFVVNFVNEDSQIFKNSMHPIFLFLSWKIFCRIIQFPFRRNCFPDVINSFFNTFVINFFHFFFLSINRSILIKKKLLFNNPPSKKNPIIGSKNRKYLTGLISTESSTHRVSQFDY